MSNVKVYDEPEWSCHPNYKIWLEVLKEGVIVDTIDLSEKRFYIAGRQLDICDIAMEHPSISRQHAVYQHGEKGLTLYDLASAQGTFVNKTKISPLVHEPLRVGDVIRFAVSSRLYIVCGPEDLRPPEYDSDNIRKFREKISQKEEKAAEKMKEGISWGFSDDAENDSEEVDDEINHMEANGMKKKKVLPDYLKNDDNYARKYGDKYELRVKESDLSEKDKGVYEKIRKRALKITNMQEEIRRIYLKEGSQDNGLTEGQLAAVHRNDTRIEVLQAEIEVLENDLLLKKGDFLHKSNKKRGSGAFNNDDNDDEVIDTTSDTLDVEGSWRLRRKLNTGDSRPEARRVNRGDTAPTSHSLSHKDIQLLLNNEKTKLDTLLSSQAQIINDEKNYSLTLGSIDDEIEAEVSRAQHIERREVLVKLAADIKSAENNVASYDRLLRLTAPAIHSLAKSIKQSSEGKVKPLDDGNDHLKEVNSLKQSEVTKNPRSRIIRKKDVSDQGLSNVLAAVRKEVQLYDEEAVDCEERIIETKRERREIGPSKPLQACSKIVPGSSSSLEGGDVPWLPPAGQSGDGRTSLNDKLGY